MHLLALEMAAFSMPFIATLQSATGSMRLSRASRRVLAVNKRAADEAQRLNDKYGKARVRRVIAKVRADMNREQHSVDDGGGDYDAPNYDGAEPVEGSGALDAQAAAAAKAPRSQRPRPPPRSRT